MTNTRMGVLVILIAAGMALCIGFIPDKQASAFLTFASSIAAGGIGLLGTDSKKQS
jgi:uncharacterized membrane protein YoaK (UPF0700 family)